MSLHAATALAVVMYLAGMAEGTLTTLATREFDDGREALSFWLIGTFLIVGAAAGALYVLGVLP